MKIGPRIGPRIGVVIGPASDDPLAGVTRDASSGIYAPADEDEWATVLAVAGIESGGPSGLWLCQDASGNLSAAIGTVEIDNPSGTLTYESAIAGWSRLGVKFAATNGAFRCLDAGLPNPQTTSVLWLLYYNHVTTPAAQRTLFSNGVEGGGNYTRLDITTGDKLRFTVAGTNEATAVSSLTGVSPVIIQSNVTATSTLVYTEDDALVPAYELMTADKDVRIGNSINEAPLDGSLAYLVMFSGAAAEMTEAQIRTLLETLNWAPAW